MIRLSSGSNYSNKYSSEMMGTEITNSDRKPQLPRHISSLESGSYSRSDWKKTQTLSACPLSQELPTNAAWDLLKYQLSDRAARQTHTANLQANLEHRLRVARVQGNKGLVRVLQSEFRQLQNN